MKLSVKTGGVLLALVAFTGCNGCNKTNPANSLRNTGPTNNNVSAQPSLDDLLPKKAQPKLQTLKVWVGAEELVTELALNREQQMTGMMWRTNMPENTAMIFVHPAPRQAAYWMKNCYVPLSIAYIDTDGVILEIRDLQPHDTNSVVSASEKIRFALETPQGWFLRHNVSTGAVVRTERGSLPETFLRRN
ncbi:MAG: DUF192 domain-containing protein [Pedosphaera sp.]|nr:DUF192 domain-containing protein [Pedosphaera sp.]